MRKVEKDDYSILKKKIDTGALRSKSHYPLQGITIYQKDLEKWDEMCNRNGIEYAVLRGYYGNGENGVRMLVGCRKENFLQLSLIMVEINSDGNENACYTN